MKASKRAWFPLVALAVTGVVLVASASSATAAPVAQINGRPVLGTAVLEGRVGTDARYTAMVTRYYKMITAENATKWSVIEPEQGVFNFEPMDKIVAFAQQRGLKVQGMPLIWWQSNPAWLRNGTFTRAEMIAIMQNHIRTIVGRYAGKVAVWNVVSEHVGFALPNLFNQRIGPEYLDIAFRTARAADPTAKLYYNDMGGEVPSWRYDLSLAIARTLKAKGVPIDGMGLQMHTTTSKTPVGQPLGATNIRPSGGQIVKVMKSYLKLGLDVAITEMDVRIYPPITKKTWKEQAAVYKIVYKACIKLPNCKSLTTWGFSDRHSWVPAWTGNKAGNALPFDVNFAPKPAARIFFNV